MDLSKEELHAIIQRAIALKHSPSLSSDPLKHKTLAMIFEKSSTRTRVAFEVAMTQLGGTSLFLAHSDTQLGRGEPLADTARVLSRMVDFITIRTFDHATLEVFAAHSQVPVINALSDDFHPCQLLADIQTFFEHRGEIKGKNVAWVGDGHNMCQSYINAAEQFEFNLAVSCPEGFEPEAWLLKRTKANVRLIRNPLEALKNADLVATDVWTSMGDEEEGVIRIKQFAGYQVNAELMALANPDALFMHCLPAHRGEEVSAEILDAPNSVVWEEAENRLHTKKALLEFLSQ